MNTAGPSKPRLRGVFHLVGALMALPAAIALVYRAPEGRATIAAAVYGASLFVLLAVSASYHVPHWGPAAKAFMRRLDHSAIFVLIAGTYTPICLLMLGPEVGPVLLTGVWVGAGFGVVKSIFWTNPPRALNVGIYIVLGWAMLPFAVTIFEQLTAAELTLLGMGGVLYSVGAIGYAKRWPDPFPRTFGYHEVYHAFVLAAAASHFTMLWAAI